MPLLDTCINAIFEPGNIGSSSGTTPTVITPGTILDPPDGYDPETVTYSLDYSKFYNSMYLLLLMFGGGNGGVVFSGGSGTIPMSLSDPRFSANTASAIDPVGTVSNKDWTEAPGYADGDQCWFWFSGVVNVNQCRIDWREGPRLTASGGTLTLDECYIHCVGFGADHADAFQAFGQTGGTFSLTNCYVRAHTGDEARDLYGGTAVDSTCIFWADDAVGTVQLSNVILHGGERMVNIYGSTTGAVHVDFNHVYFVVEPGYPENYLIDIRAVGGTLIIDQWNEVREATIVAGVLVPGAIIPSP